MKTKRTKKLSVYAALITSIIICFLFASKSYSSIHEPDSIILEGTWHTSPEDELMEYSLPTIPITVYLWNNYLNIQNDSPDCDITVSISSLATGKTVHQQTIPEVETANVLIPTSNLAAGEYRIELTGPGTRYLEGTFRK